MKRWGWLAIVLIGSACGDDGSSGGTDGSSSGEPASSTGDTPTTAGSSSSGGSPDEGSSSSSGTPNPTGPSSCSGTCAPPIPSGWEGPVKTGANAVDCNGGFADPAGAFFSDFDPGQEACDCDCQPVDAACAATVEVQVYGAGGCAAEPDYVANVDDTACFTFEGPFPAALDDPAAPTVLAADFFSIAPVLVEGGTCAAEGTFNKGGFNDSVQLCAPTAEPSLCDEGGPCIADNSDTCVFQEGEHECPDGYPVQTLGFSGADDQRECGECDCGTPEGLCEASLTLQTDACGAGTTITNADCLDIGNTAITSATYDPGEATITCGGGTGTAPISGTVEPTNPVTICCVE